MGEYYNNQIQIKSVLSYIDFFRVIHIVILEILAGHSTFIWYHCKGGYVLLTDTHIICHPIVNEIFPGLHRHIQTSTQ